jgi:uncharacterized protein
MSFYPNSNAEARPAFLDLTAVMRQVYLWMTLGLLVAFGVATAVGVPARAAFEAALVSGVRPNLILLNPVVMIVSIIAYIILAFALQPIIMRASPAVSSVCYLLFTALFGFMMSVIFIQYRATTIATAFVGTAGMFAAMSIYGYTTKTDLSRYRNLLFMALLGLIIATFVNFLFASSALYWLINYAGVLIFVALTAYDTQWIKNYAASVSTSSDREMAQRVALVGAFHLFLDFVNLFLFILRILGSGSRR